MAAMETGMCMTHFSVLMSMGKGTVKKSKKERGGEGRGEWKTVEKKYNGLCIMF